MAITKKRSSASATVLKTAIEQASSTLRDLPEKPKDTWSLREAISLLHDSITTALDRGYNYDEVVGILADQGVEITAASLKRYLAAAKREVAVKPKRTGRTTAGRSRNASLEKQAEVLTNADVPTQQEPVATPTAESETAEKPKRHRTTSTTRSTKATEKESAKSKTAAKAKPTTRAKTTSRSTSTRTRRKQSNRASE
ncbi:MAG: hypothetical protein HC769_02850 [Cyanobacteria bacterium CRU_2_1]|nr:hypothetical protein [Cyanobacteria bacterium RU_5_0]NJR57877.1 hypothetical protein [Cyanobacteria bacterium CRU_2_1]